MQSYSIESANGQAKLHLQDIGRPVPGPGQVLLRLHAAGLNRGELIAAHASTGAASRPKPLGSEGAGEVIELAADVSNVKMGDRVMGRCYGAFAEYALMDAAEAMLIPDGPSWQEAAAIPLAYLVAYDMLVVQGKLQADEWLLITGASSGVGVACLQLAKALKSRVAGTSGSAEKLARLQALGLDVGIQTRSPDFCDAVMQTTQDKGANLVVNNVGGSVFAECMRSMAYEGRFATVGYLDGQLSSNIDIGLLHAKRLVLFGVSNKLRSAAERAALVQRFTADILPLFAGGQLRALIDRSYPFEELPAAIQHMEANRHVGKIVMMA